MSAGALDPTFGSAGRTYAPVDAHFAVTLAVDASGRVLEGAADTNRTAGESLATVSRLTVAGTPDVTFGVNGTAVVPGNTVTATLVEPNGDILVYTGTYAYGGHPGLTRLTPNGQVDPTFGTAGSVATDGYDPALAVTPDNKIVEYDAGNGVVYRLNANGSPDATFGTGGQVSVAALLPPGSPHMFVGGQYTGGGSLPVAVDSAGRIDLSVLTQTVQKAPLVDSVLRLTATGRADTSFGTAGVAVVPPGPSPDGANALAVAPDGTVYQAFTVRLPEQGGPSQTYLYSYGTDGRTVSGGAIAGPASGVVLASLAVDPSGRPVLAVQAGDSSTGDSAIDRFLPIAAGGTPTFDPTFAASGSVDLIGDFNPAYFDVYDAAVDPSGNVDLIGSNASDFIERVQGSGPSAVTPVAATGTVIGSAGSWSNQGNTIAKAFDGNLNSYYDAYDWSGDWAGLDLGASAPPVVQIAFAPRPGYEFRMIGGQFQVSSTADFSANVRTIYTVTTTPTAGPLTTVAVGDIGPYRYVRYIGPDEGNCNVAEIQVRVAGPTQLTGTAIGSAGSWAGQGNTFAKALDGNLNTFYDAYAYSGDWVGEDLGSARSVAQVKLAPRAGYESRMVGGMIQASNSADFSNAVTAYTITQPLPSGTLTTVALNTNVGAYEYWRYVGPNGGECNIAELEFDG